MIGLLVGLPLIVVGAYLWFTGWVVHAWRTGEPYSMWWGVWDGWSVSDGRIRSDLVELWSDEEIAEYAWSFRRNVRTMLRLGL